MRPEKKTERTLQKLQEYLLSTGVSPETLEAAAQNPVESRDEKALQAEAVLDYVDNPRKYLQKKCKRCKEPFLANLRSVAYCSDHCRGRALQALGIQWNPHRPIADRWRGNPPMIVPAAALRQIASLATQASVQMYMEKDSSQEPNAAHSGQTLEEVPAQMTNGSHTNLLSLPEPLDFETSEDPFAI